MSQNHNLSRRDFLKATMLGMVATFLAACGRALGITPTSSPTLTSTSTNTPQRTATNTATPTPTDTPTATPIPCFKLLTPENSAKLPALGLVTFSWEPMPGATRYQLQFTLPSTQIVSFDVGNTSSTRYLESFLAGGTYSWWVIAFDSIGIVICASNPFAFIKDDSNKPDSNKHDNDGSGSSGSSGTINTIQNT